MLINGIKTSPVVGCIKGIVQGNNFSALSSFLKTFGERNINILFAVQIRNSNDLIDITLCINPDRVEEGIAIIKKISPNIRVTTLPSLNIISVFPYRDNPEISFIFLKTLENESIPVLAVSTSLSSISCLVPHDQIKEAEDYLKKAFGLIRQRNING